MRNRFSRACVGERGEGRGLDVSAPSGDRCPVRIVTREPERAGHLFDESLGCGMLESLSLIVYVVPSVAEPLA